MLYYVESSIGNDDNDGLTINTPLKTLTKLRETIQNGDMAALMDGYLHYPDFNELPMLPPPCKSGYSTLSVIDGEVQPCATCLMSPPMNNVSE